MEVIDATLEERVGGLETEVETIKTVIDIRRCKCGCGRGLNGRIDQKFATKACKQRAFRRGRVEPGVEESE